LTWLLKEFRPRLLPKEGIQPLSLDVAKKIIQIQNKNKGINIFELTTSLNEELESLIGGNSIDLIDLNL
jgi:hypothetical protein